jgi:hypothetical protein
MGDDELTTDTCNLRDRYDIEILIKEMAAYHPRNCYQSDYDHRSQINRKQG